MAEFVIEPTYWISLQVPGILFTVIHLLIVKHEIKKRNHTSAKFTTKSLKYTSLLCILSGFLANISWLLQWFNGLCVFMTWLGSTFSYLQFLSMGFYQLSRLYYSFANSQIHSGKGYPKWVFIFMIIYGIVIFLSYSIVTMFEQFLGFNVKCGINSNFETYSHPMVNTHQLLIDVSIYISMLLYTIWDLLTLSLYMNKIRLFKEYKHSQPMVYKRILSILYKITIITLFYIILFLMIIALAIALQIFVLGTASQSTVWIIVGSGPRLSTLSYSMAMMLMMDYNDDLYGKFLRVIYGFKLHFCCCCCRYMVIEQLSDDQENRDKLEMKKSVTSNATTGQMTNGTTLQIDITQENGQQDKIPSITPTKNVSVNIANIVSSGCSLSMETPDV